jgi:hypothetical protein
VTRFVLAMVMVMASAVRAEPQKPSYALFRLDPLGLQPEIVDQLERILRAELERIVGKLPSRAEVERVAASNPKLAGCTADPACLKPLANQLKADRIIAGNVGGLADSYVVNLKLAENGRELRRVTATLHGSSEELIAEVRVAAYRLAAPEKLVGAIDILTDVPGANVFLDGNIVGLTPLPGPLREISAGVHKLRVEREGFSTFEEDVPVRFEKNTEVVVRQSATTVKARKAMQNAGKLPVYTKWYFWATIVTGAILTGMLIGYEIPKQRAQ